MRAPKIAFLAPALVLGFVPAGAFAEPDPAPPPPKVAEGETAFACELMKALGGKGGNLFLSPWSVSTALAMARQGAAGKTAQQMDVVLGLPDGSGAAYRAVVERLLAAKKVKDAAADGKIEEVPAYELNVANGVFSQAGWAYEPAFRSSVADDFKAELREVDFQKPEGARLEINGWVAKATKDRIQDLVPAGLPLPGTRMVLANAIRFQGAWQKAFEASATVEKPFAAGGGGSVSAKLMRRTGHLRYAETEDAQVLEIPYRAGETTMLVVLPRKKDGLDAVVAGLSGSSLSKWVAALTSKNVALELPKFTFTSDASLGETLAKMGMTDAFDEARADFSGITKTERLFVSAVLHKAFVAVDEKGTEAAAATAVMMMPTGAARPEEPVAFVADHPFLFAIRHPATGVVLFLGRLTDPSKP